MTPQLWLQAGRLDSPNPYYCKGYPWIFPHKAHGKRQRYKELCHHTDEIYTGLQSPHKDVECQLLVLRVSGPERGQGLRPLPYISQSPGSIRTTLGSLSTGRSDPLLGTVT